MKNICLLLVAALTLAGCATPYQKVGVFTLTGGFSDKKLADDRYEVTFSGNGYTNNTMAEDLANLRGAELCQAAGYEYVRMTKGTLTVTQLRGAYTYADSPTAVAEFQCSHYPDIASNKVDEVIAKTRAAYPKAMPKTQAASSSPSSGS